MSANDTSRLIESNDSPERETTVTRNGRRRRTTRRKKAVATKTTATKKKTGAARKTKTTARKRSPSSRITTLHIEYMPLDPALVRGGGTTRRDPVSRSSTSRARTERLRGARVYRTGADQLTIQQADGDELIFSISRLIRIAELSRDLAVTREVPNFY